MFSLKSHSARVPPLCPSCLNKKQNKKTPKIQPQNSQIPKRLKLCTSVRLCASGIANYQAKLPFNYIYLQKSYLLLSLTISFKSLCQPIGPVLLTMFTCGATPTLVLALACECQDEESRVELFYCSYVSANILDWSMVF